MEIWQKICDKKIPYLMVFAVWVFPILTSLPKTFEEGVTFERAQEAERARKSSQAVKLENVKQQNERYK